MRVELRDDRVIVEGYVNAVERDSKEMSDGEGRRFVEQIMAGVFDRALQKNRQVMLLNHDLTRVLAEGDSLELYEDAIGLHARAEVTDPEVIELGHSHAFKGWSFGFRDWKSEDEELPDGRFRRRITDLVLDEVSLITGAFTPAYNGTLAEARADDLRAIETRVIYTEVETPKEAPDLSEYHARIKEIERRSRHERA